MTAAPAVPVPCAHCQAPVRGRSPAGPPLCRRAPVSDVDLIAEDEAA